MYCKKNSHIYYSFFIISGQTYQQNKKHAAELVARLIGLFNKNNIDTLPKNEFHQTVINVDRMTLDRAFSLTSLVRKLLGTQDHLSVENIIKSQ